MMSCISQLTLECEFVAEDKPVPRVGFNIKAGPVKFGFLNENVTVDLSSTSFL